MAQPGFGIAIPAALAERVLKAFNPIGTELATEAARLNAKQECGAAIAEAVHRIEIRRANAAIGEPPAGIE